MIRLTAILVWASICLAPCCPAEGPPGVIISNDGLFRFNLTGGTTTWSGTTTVEHPRFHWKVRGSVSMFGGPSIRRKPATIGHAKGSGFQTEPQWISLVALGAITVTVADATGKPTVIEATRVVFVPAEDRLLIDGQPWPLRGQPETPDAPEGPDQQGQPLPSPAAYPASFRSTASKSNPPE